MPDFGHGTVQEQENKEGLHVLRNHTALCRTTRSVRNARKKENGMIKDKEFFVYKAFGGLMALAASVAADCPADFAECVKAWNPDKIADIIEALEEERRKEIG